MARLPGTTYGAELNDITEMGVANIGANSTLAVVAATPAARSGGYCLKIACTAAAAPTSFLRTTYGANKTNVWHRIGFYHHGLVTGGSLTFFRVYDDAGVIQLTFTIDPVDNLIRAYRGAPTANLLGVTSAVCTPDAWHYLDIHLVISATVGVVEVWIDGNQRLNLTAQNTIASTAHALILNYDLCFVASGANQANGSYVAFDDHAANDTAGSINNGRIGDGRVLLLSPTGAGTNTNQSLGGSSPAATNWQSVNDIPPDAGVTFVYSSTPTTRDTYALSDLPAGATTVNAVEILAQCQKSDAGAGSIGLTTKSGGTTTEAAAQALSTSWAYYRSLLELDPATSAQWLVAAVNSLECGTTAE